LGKPKTAELGGGKAGSGEIKPGWLGLLRVHNGGCVAVLAAAVQAKSRARTCRLAEESRKWRPARRNKMTLETGSTAVCDRCRRDFSPRRRDTRFCSAACKQAAYRLRLEAAEEEARRAAEAARKAAEAAAEVTRRACPCPVRVRPPTRSHAVVCLPPWTSPKPAPVATLRFGTAPLHPTSHRSPAWRDLAPCQLRIEHPQFLNSGGFRAALFAARAVIPVTALRGACF
jgi:hypothetical protein